MARGLLVAVNLAVVAFFMLSFARHRIGFGPYRLDLDVYRIGGRVWLDHGDLYGLLPRTSSGVELPFTYPPIAAVLLSPFALMPLAVDGVLLTLASIALTALVLRVYLRSAVGPQAGSWWTIGCLLPVALLMEPVRSTLGFGQVNIALMALVAVDCLSPTVRWPRGAAVGLAAAVKLTPAAFVLFFLCRGDRRAAGTAAVSFATFSAAGFLLAWHDSVRYWTSIVFQTSRPGSPIFAANQSIQAVLGRAGLNPHTPAGTAAWLALSAVVLVLACAGMRPAVARSADAWALSLNAFAALLISPISWSHHWVWAEPGLLALAVMSWRRGHRAGLVTAAAGLVVFAAGAQWWLPHSGNRELHWAVWQQIIGSLYVIFAFAVLLLSARRAGAAGRDHHCSPAGRSTLGGVRRLTRAASISSAAALTALATGCSAAQGAVGSSIAATTAYIQQPTGKTTVGYLDIRNNGGADRLISVSTSVGGTVVFRAPVRPGVAPVIMHTVPDIPIPPDSTVQLIPDSYHLLISGAGPMQNGKDITLRLTFEHAGTITILALVTNPETGGGSYFLN